MENQESRTGETTVHIPLSITIRIGQEGNAAGVASEVFVSPLEATRPVSYYDGYAGYNADFLDFNVPLPELSEEQTKNAARNNFARIGADPAVLPYTNFSVVMDRRRQLALYTVVNIDGKLSARPPRGGDRWYFDSRIAESEQIGEELYKRNALDRGHLVRRLDPVWGLNAARANDDTFHFTNCAPQHERFNQNDETWLGLENYILDAASQNSKKLTVFTGPVLDSEDPLYKGVRLPLAFWKIVVFTKKNGEPGAAAFVLEQGKLIDTLSSMETMFEPGAYRVTLDNLVERSGLNFTYLKLYELPLSENRFAAAGVGQILIAPDYSNIQGLSA